MYAFIDKVICFENENNIYFMAMYFKYCFRLILQVLCFVFSLLIVEEMQQNSTAKINLRCTSLTRSDLINQISCHFR